jgi:hypothetical protein
MVMGVIDSQLCHVQKQQEFATYVEHSGTPYVVGDSSAGL